jgi:predicted secreted protein
MAGNAVAGRSLLVKKGGTVIAGVRVTGLKFSATPIDITDADSVGLPTYLAGAVSEQSITLDVSGVHKDDTIWSIIAVPGTDRLLTDITFTHPGMAATKDVLAGNFFINAYEAGGDYKGEGTFSCSFISSGTWTAA